MLGLGGGAPLRHGLRPNAVLAHQPGHAMFLTWTKKDKEAECEASTGSDH
jgi:hypothetical protein